MPTYTTTINATSNGTINTEDTFVECSVNPLKIKRIRARLGDGTETAGVDNNYRVRVVRKTASGVGTTSVGTAVRAKQSDRVTGATVTWKNTTNNFTTATLGDIYDSVVKNGRETYEWVARDETEYVEVHPTLASGGMFAVLIQSAVASQKFNVTVVWEE